MQKKPPKQTMIRDIASGTIDRDEAMNVHKNIIGKELKTVEK